MRFRVVRKFRCRGRSVRFRSYRKPDTPKKTSKLEENTGAKIGRLAIIGPLSEVHPRSMRRDSLRRAIPHVALYTYGMVDSYEAFRFYLETFSGTPPSGPYFQSFPGISGSIIGIFQSIGVGPPSPRTLEIK